MKLRVSYTWIRYEGAAYNTENHDFMMDSEAPEITTKTQMAAYLRDWADGWTGEVILEILDISTTFGTPILAAIAEKFEGQIIKVKNNKAVFKR